MMNPDAPLLPEGLLREVYRAALRIGLDVTAICTELDPAIRQSLTIADTANTSLLIALSELNRMRLKDGSLPLRTTLQTMELLAGPRAEAEVFRRATQHLDARNPAIASSRPAKTPAPYPLNRRRAFLLYGGALLTVVVVVAAFAINSVLKKRSTDACEGSDVFVEILAKDTGDGEEPNRTNPVVVHVASRGRCTLKPLEVNVAFKKDGDSPSKRITIKVPPGARTADGYTLPIPADVIPEGDLEAHASVLLDSPDGRKYTVEAQTPLHLDGRSRSTSITGIMWDSEVALGPGHRPQGYHDLASAKSACQDGKRLPTIKEFEEAAASAKLPNRWPGAAFWTFEGTPVMPSGTNIYKPGHDTRPPLVLCVRTQGAP